jgi:hypothetical protein
MILPARIATLRRGSLAATLALLCGAAASAQESAPRYALSIYSAQANNGDALFETTDAEGSNEIGGYAVVRDRRQFTLASGNNMLEVRDVARYLDPSALSTRVLDDTDTVIVNQRFDDQALSFDALVQRQIGHAVEIAGSSSNPNAAPIIGTLLSNNGGLTVQLADGRVMTVTDYARVTFPDLPKGMSAMPALHWQVSAKRAGPRTFELVYPTQGLAWRAEYSGWLGNGGDCALSLAGWAQIANRSGASFRAAQVKLIAGTPQRLGATRPMVTTKAASAPTAAVETGMLGDLHQYTVEAPIDIADNALQRVALFAEQAVACQRQYLFEATHFRANPAMAPITDRGYGLAESSAVHAALALRIDRALPAGRVRLIQSSSAEAGSEGTPEFVAEDQIAHTPKNEPLVLQLGDVFDLRGERSQTRYEIDKDQHALSESVALRVSNASNLARNIIVREHLYRWTQWSIAQASAEYAKKNADTIEFNVAVPANGKTDIDYTVQYQWTESFK